MSTFPKFLSDNRFPRSKEFSWGSSSCVFGLCGVFLFTFFRCDLGTSWCYGPCRLHQLFETSARGNLHEEVLLFLLFIPSNLQPRFTCLRFTPTLVTSFPVPSQHCLPVDWLLETNRRTIACSQLHLFFNMMELTVFNICILRCTNLMYTVNIWCKYGDMTRILVQHIW